MIGEYERRRDDVRFPDCWRAENDHCSPHFHSSMEVVYLLRGSIGVTLNGQSHLLRPGQVAISSSYTLHSYETTGSSLSVILTVPLDFVPSLQKLLATRRLANSVVTDTTGGELLHCLMQMERQTRVGGSPTVLKGYVYTCLGLLVELAGLEEIQDRQNADFAREVLNYIQDNYLSELTLELAAAHFGYSKSRFSHLFSEQFGYGFCEYLNVIRCRHAATLLVNNDVGMIGAAMGSGFGNMRTFYRCFRRVFNMTPTQLLEGGITPQFGRYDVGGVPPPAGR